MKQVRAVEARIEIDFRIGTAFTRFQTILLQNSFRSELNSKVISYGSCQFPTLGFVVDQYKRVKNFEPETFWYLSIDVKIPPEYLTKLDEEMEVTTTKSRKKTTKKANQDIITFNWERTHLFDHLATTVLFERCADTGYRARVASIVEKPTSRWRPLPLTTLELQKVGATFFGLSSKRIMDVAESLYTKGFISYPRTETDQFDSALDLRGLVRKQCASSEWGNFAKGLLGEHPTDPNAPAFTNPRQGKNNDKAHPPIHPIIAVERSALETNDHYEVYKFIARRFLACCSPDAVGSMTTLTLDWAGEKFKVSGSVVHERNFLDVYPYQKWETSAIQIPAGFFKEGEMVDLNSAEMKEGKTTSPTFLTEPELLSLMDLNGIGTDSTMADHIDTILAREYVFKHVVGQTGTGARRGRNAGTASAPLPVFLPSNLGIALVEGYDEIGFDMSLSKPFLRKEMEDNMRAIIDGRMTKQQVVSESVNKYREVYGVAKNQSSVLLNCTRRYLNTNT